MTTLCKMFSEWTFKPWDTSKTHLYYMSILEATDFVTIKHHYLPDNPTEPAYSTLQIHKVLTPLDWGQDLHQTHKLPLSFQTRVTHCLTFNYWDYQQV